MYVYCNTAKRYIRETPRRFFSQLHTFLSLSLSSFFPSFDKQTAQCKGCEIGHVRRESSYSSRVIVEWSDYRIFLAWLIHESFPISQCVFFLILSRQLQEFATIRRNAMYRLYSKRNLARARFCIQVCIRCIICVDDATDCLCVDTPCVHTISFGALFSAC